MNSKFLLLCILLCAFSFDLFSQSTLCAESEPFCTSDVISFPAGGSTENAEPGPDYGCISNYLEDPAWFHMLISTGGDLEITISNDNDVDIDYICWGPFDDPHAPCNGQLTSSTIRSCSMASASTEICTIDNAIAGKYYILLITNWKSEACNITFSKTGGSGETDCNIIPSAASNNGPICEGETLELYADYLENASYTWSGPNGFTSNEQNPIITNATPAYSGTYFLVVHFDGNSSSPFITEVVVNAAANADFIFENNCEGSIIQFTDISSCNNTSTPISSWNWNFGDGNSSTQQNPTHTYAIGNSGTFNVQLIVETSAGCSDSIEYQIEIYENPIALFSSDFTNGASCINSEINFSDQSSSNVGEITNWNWDFGDGNSSTDQNPTHIYNSSGTFSVSLTISTEFGCDSIYEETININPTPSIDFSFTEVCFGSLTLFYDTNHINVDATSEWLYDFGDGNTSLESNPSHLYNEAGNFNVHFSIVDTNGCFNEVEHNVSVFEAPTANFTSNDVCLFSVTEFNDISAPQNGIDFWDWNFGDGETSNQQNPTHIYAESGSYEVQLIVGNYDGCSDTLSGTTNVWEPPVSHFNYSDTSCSTGLIYFADSSYSSESEISELTWYFPDGHISHAPNTYFVFLNPETYYNVSLYVEDIRGCSDTLMEEIYIEPDLQISFNADTVCFGDTTNLGAYIVKPETDSIIRYTWWFRDGSPQVTTPNDSIFHIFEEAGNFEVMLQAKNVDGCLNVVRKNVKVRPNPISDFSFTESYCNDSSLFIDESLEAEGSIQYWKWYFGDGDSLEVYSPVNPNTYHQYPPQFNIYNTSLIIKDQYNCKDTIYKELTHYPCIVVNHFIDTSWICSSSPAVLIDSTIIDPDYSVSKKVWDFGNGDSQEVDPNQDTIEYQYNQHGIYHTKLLIEYHLDNIVVHDSSEKILEVLPTPEADFQLEDVCFGSNSLLNELSSIPEGEIEEVYWDFGDGRDTIYDYIQGQNEIQHLYYKDSTFRISLQIIAKNNCVDSISKSTTIFPLPKAGFEVDSTIFCGNAEIIFRDTSKINSGHIANRLWTFGDGDFMATNSDTVSHFYLEGIYNIGLEVTSNEFCTDYVEIEDLILINPVVESDFEINPKEASISNKKLLEIDNYVNEDVYLKWTLSDSIKWENIYSPNFTDSIHDTGIYTMKQYTINEFGCMDSSSVKFVVLPNYSFFIPTAFSPNNNGVNETWGPIGKYFDMESYELMIFSRWGEMIFKTNDFFTQWDGRLPNGDIAPIGSYAYIIRLMDLEGNNKIMKGSVVLLL